MVKVNVQILNELKIFLEQAASNVELRSLYSFSEKDFTRDRSLPFCTLVLFILNLPKRSLSIELKSFFGLLGKKSCSKAAFCMQRAKLKPNFFESWNAMLISRFYYHYGAKVKRWKGFILLAIDGSVFSLPDKKELRTLYGSASNGKGQQGVVARSGIVYDVLNQLVIAGKLHSYLTSERSVIKELLKHTPKDSLLTFDRGYPGFELFYLLTQQQYRFVMRVSTQFNNTIKAFYRSSRQDSIESFYPSLEVVKQMRKMGIEVSRETSISLRLVKVLLNTGETEILITNLYSEQKYSINDLRKVYFLRWGVETFYGTAKNQLQIECFSGIRPVCIQQDYFANLFVYNLQSMIEKQCESGLEKINKQRNLDYKINKNVSWASLKEWMVYLFLTSDSSEILLELQNLFQQHLEPIRPNRKYPRIRKSIPGNGKYRTLTNYKRAI